MKALCWDSFFVGWLSLNLVLNATTGRWGYAALDVALVCFFGWAMDYKARRQEEREAEAHE